MSTTLPEGIDEPSRSLPSRGDALTDAELDSIARARGILPKVRKMDAASVTTKGVPNAVNPDPTKSPFYNLAGQQDILDKARFRSSRARTGSFGQAYDEPDVLSHVLDEAGRDQNAARRGTVWKIVNLLTLDNQASAGIALNLARGGRETWDMLMSALHGETYKKPEGKPGFTLNPIKAAGQGISEHVYYKDVFAELGLDDPKLAFDLPGLPKMTPATPLGIAGDIFLSPTMYTGFGAYTKTGRLAQAYKGAREAGLMLEDMGKLGDDVARAIAENKVLDLAPTLKGRIKAGQQRFVVLEHPFRTPRLVRLGEIPALAKAGEVVREWAPFIPESLDRLPLTAVTAPVGAALGAAAAPEGERLKGAVAGAAFGAIPGVSFLRQAGEAGTIGGSRMTLGHIPGSKRFVVGGAAVAGGIVGGTVGVIQPGTPAERIKRGLKGVAVGTGVGAGAGLAAGGFTGFVREVFDAEKGLRDKRLGQAILEIPLFKLPALEPYSVKGIEAIGYAPLEAGIVGFMGRAAGWIRGAPIAGHVIEAAGQAFDPYWRPLGADPVVAEDVASELRTFAAKLGAAKREDRDMLYNAFASEEANAVSRKVVPILRKMGFDDDGIVLPMFRGLVNKEDRIALLRSMEEGEKLLGPEGGRAAELVQRALATAPPSTALLAERYAGISKELAASALADGLDSYRRARAINEEDIRLIAAGLEPKREALRGLKTPEAMLEHLRQENDWLDLMAAQHEKGIRDLEAAGLAERGPSGGGGPERPPEGPAPEPAPPRPPAPTGSPLERKPPTLPADYPVGPARQPASEILDIRKGLLEDVKTLDKELVTARAYTQGATKDELEAIRARVGKVLEARTGKMRDLDLVDKHLTLAADDLAQSEALREAGKKAAEHPGAGLNAVETLPEAQRELETLRQDLAQGRGAPDTIRRAIADLEHDTVRSYVERATKEAPQSFPEALDRASAMALRTHQEAQAAQEAEKVVAEATTRAEKALGAPQGRGVAPAGLHPSQMTLDQLEASLGPRLEYEVVAGETRAALEELARVDPEAATRLATEAGVPEDLLPPSVLRAQRAAPVATTGDAVADAVATQAGMDAQELIEHAWTAQPGRFGMDLAERMRAAGVPEREIRSVDYLDLQGRILENQARARVASLGDGPFRAEGLGVSQERLGLDLMPKLSQHVEMVRQAIPGYEPRFVGVDVIGPYRTGAGRPGDPVDVVIFYTNGDTDIGRMTTALRRDPGFRVTGNPGAPLAPTPISVQTHLLMDGETPRMVAEALSPRVPRVRATRPQRIVHFTTTENAAAILREGYDVKKPPIHGMGGLQGGPVERAADNVLYFTTDAERWSTAEVWVGPGKGDVSRGVYDYEAQKWVTAENAYQHLDLTAVGAHIVEGARVRVIDSIAAADEFLGEAGATERGLPGTLLRRLVEKGRDQGYDVVNLRDPGGDAWAGRRANKYGERNLYMDRTGNSGRDDWFILNPNAIQLERPAPNVYGRLVTASGPDPNVAYEFRYKVLSLDDLVTSHTETMAPNPAFPVELQPRQRDRAASRLQVERIGTSLNPDAMLKDVGRLDQGPMIVGADNVVESGNGRALALRFANAQNKPGFAAYQKALAEKLQDLGLPGDALRDIKNPVLVRERVSQVDRVAFTREANEAVALGMSPVERAAVESQSLTEDMISHLEVTESETIEQALNRAANRPLVGRFLQGIPENERATLLGAKGDLNQTGVSRIKAALFARTYPGEAGQRLATAVFESTDSGIKRLETAMFSSLGRMAQAESLVRSGARARNFAFAEDLSKAVDMLARLRQSGTRVDQYLGTIGMFGNELSPLQEALLRHLDEISGSTGKLREFFSGYAEKVIGAADPNQAALFAQESLTRAEILGVLGVKNIPPMSAAERGLLHEVEPALDAMDVLRKNPEHVVTVEPGDAATRVHRSIEEKIENARQAAREVLDTPGEDSVTRAAAEKAQFDLENKAPRGLRAGGETLDEATERIQGKPVKRKVPPSRVKRPLKASGESIPAPGQTPREITEGFQEADVFAAMAKMEPALRRSVIVTPSRIGAKSEIVEIAADQSLADWLRGRVESTETIKTFAHDTSENSVVLSTQHATYEFTWGGPTPDGRAAAEAVEDAARRGESPTHTLTDIVKNEDGQIDREFLWKAWREIGKRSGLMRSVATEHIDDLIRFSPRHRDQMMRVRQEMIELLATRYQSEARWGHGGGHVFQYAPHVPPEKTFVASVVGRGAIKDWRKSFEIKRSLMTSIYEANRLAELAGRKPVFEKDPLIALQVRLAHSQEAVHTSEFLERMLERHGVAVAAVNPETWRARFAVWQKMGTATTEDLARAQEHIRVMEQIVGTNDRLRPALESLSAIVDQHGSIKEPLEKLREVPEIKEYLRARSELEQILPEVEVVLPRGEYRRYPAYSVPGSYIAEAEGAKQMGAMEAKARDVLATFTGLNTRADEPLIVVPLHKIKQVMVQDPFVRAYLVPKQVADALNKGIRNHIQMGPELHAITRIYDHVMSLWRGMTTVWFPVFHTRNAGSAVWNNLLDGITAPERYTQAMSVLTREKGFELVDAWGRRIPGEQLLKEAKEFGVGQHGSPMAELMEEGLTGRHWWDFVNPLSTRFAPTRVGRALNRSIENTVRLATYLDGRYRGWTPAVAARRVTRLQFDYAELTPVERDIFRRLTAFYTWTRKNIPLQMHYMFTRPAKWTIPVKAARGLEGAVPAPEYEDLLGDEKDKMLPVRVRRNADGTYQYWYMAAWWPGADIWRLTDPEGEALGMLTPVLKAPLEMHFNVSLFWDSPIERTPGQTGYFLGRRMSAKEIALLKNLRFLNEFDRVVYKQILSGRTKPSTALLESVFGRSYTVEFNREAYWRLNDLEKQHAAYEAGGKAELDKNDAEIKAGTRKPEDRFDERIKEYERMLDQIEAEYDRVAAEARGIKEKEQP